MLTEGLDWRWVLLINVPLGALVLTAAARWIQESKAGGERRLDLPGAVLVTAGTATLAYGVVQTEAEGWGAAATLVPLGVALALIVIVPRRRGAHAAAADAARPVPGPRGLGGQRGDVRVRLRIFAMWFFMTLYAQNVLGYTPIEAGLALVPSSLAVVAGSKIAPRLMRRVGRTGRRGRPAYSSPPPGSPGSRR